MGSDLASKYWAFSIERQRLPLRVLSGFIEIRTALNEGAVFGLGKGRGGVFVILTLFAILYIIYLLLRSSSRGSTLYCTFLLLILSGAIGNLYDRLVYGKVRDFVYLAIKIGEKDLWPYIFNLADVYLVVGVIGLTLGWLLGFFEYPVDIDSIQDAVSSFNVEGTDRDRTSTDKREY